MALAADERLGADGIVGTLRAGGTAEAHRARGSLPGHRIAIEALPAGLLSHSQQRACPAQEARAASALNHPDLATIHEIKAVRPEDAPVLAGVGCRSVGSAATRRDQMRLILVSIMAIFTATAAAAATAVVDCDRGDSVNATLERLRNLAETRPLDMWVKGTCTEYVRIHGFENLTLTALPGATLVRPGTPPDAVLGGGVLTIDASRSVTVNGLTVQAGRSTAVAIRGGSSDVRLRNITADDLIMIYEGSQASLAGITVVNPSRWTAVGVYDLSDVHLEDSLLECTLNYCSSGVSVMKSLVTMHGTVIRGFLTGMASVARGHIDVSGFASFVPEEGPVDEVLIEGSAVGCDVDGGRLTLGSPLRITGPGRANQGVTGGVRVRNGGSLDAGNALTISGSIGQGVLVEGNSVARLGASTISGGSRGGLVVVNQSMVAVAGTTLSGNVTDVFCDSTSLVTNGTSIVGATNIQCSHLQPWNYEVPLP